jgi:hypothetical protein
MAREQRVSGPAAASRVCECGNSGAHEGFYPCDADGRQLYSEAPLECCRRCGKITEVKTGRCAGHRSFALPVSSD